MAWYLFSSGSVAKSESELLNHDKMPPEQFGHRTAGGRDIPHTFRKNIGLSELAQAPKGTSAILTLDIGQTKRFLECRIDALKTKAAEVVSFPFGLQYDSDPSRTGQIHGNVLFLELANFDRDKFELGPQGKAALLLIFGPGS